MIITIDRNSKLFTPEASDRINIQSEEIYNEINNIYTPPLMFKENVSQFNLNSTHQFLYQGNFKFGRVNVLNFTLKGKFKSTWHYVEGMKNANGILTNGYYDIIKVADIPCAPVCDIILFNDEGVMYTIKQGTNSIYMNTFDKEIENPKFFTYYIN